MIQPAFRAFFGSDSSARMSKHLQNSLKRTLCIDKPLCNHAKFFAFSLYNQNQKAHHARPLAKQRDAPPLSCKCLTPSGPWRPTSAHRPRLSSSIRLYSSKARSKVANPEESLVKSPLLRLLATLGPWRIRLLLVNRLR